MLFEIGAFRHVDRVWRQFMGPDVANCSEHTFRVAWVALTLARYETKTKNDIDIEKLLKIALIHDLAESRCGDVHYLSRQYVERKETDAIKDIFEGTCFGKEMEEIIKEYEDRKTIESRIVKDADNIDVELELREMTSRGQSLGVLWNKRRQKMVQPKLYTDAARKFWKDIRKADPHDWHSLSTKNRFQGGDWVFKARP